MSQAAWPTEAEVGAAVASQGLTAPADLDVHIGAAITSFQDMTGFNPFLEGASDDRRYDPPEYSDTLDLRGGFTSVTEVRVGLSYSDTTGTVLVETRDFDLLPLNARERNKPFTSIRFQSSLGCLPNSIKVTGLPGFDDEIPDDAWLAVRDAAMGLALLEILSGASTASEVQQGPVRIKFDNEEGRSKIDRWLAGLKTVAARYKRIIV